MSGKGYEPEKKYRLTIVVELRGKQILKFIEELKKKKYFHHWWLQS